MGSRSLLVSKTEIIQYLYIFLIFQYAGGRVFAAIGSDNGYLITLILCGLSGVIFSKALLYHNSYMRFVIVTFGLCVVGVIITGLDLSMGTVLSLISRLLLIYIAVYIDPENFSLRLVKLVYLMCVISLIEFGVISVIGADRAISLFFSNLYEIPCGHEWLGSSYGLFLIGFNFMDPTRNAYMFGEAGEFQAVVVMALYFIICGFVDLEDRKKRRYLLVLFITLITVQSTTGYFAAIVLVCMLLNSKNTAINDRIKRIAVLLIAIAGIYILFFASENSIVYTRFLNKFTAGNKIDFAVYTGEDRVAALVTFGKLLSDSFFSVLFGMGYTGLIEKTGTFLCAGLINFLLMFGLIVGVYTLIVIVFHIYDNFKKMFEVLCTLFLFVNMGLSQPDLMAITSLIIIFYPWIYETFTGIKIRNQCEFELQI